MYEKTCATCGEIKSKDLFHNDVKQTDRLRGECKECARKRNRESYQNDPRVGMLRGAKYRSKNSGIPFDLDKDAITIPDQCPVLGIPLFFTYGSRATKDNQPSLDRLDPSKGYVRGNVAVISFRANRIKSNATSDEVLAVADWMKTKGL
tara:strand:- start:76 stop:522 length:447 start_codon:yes stop_codon:yes gene_type:complete